MALENDVCCNCKNFHIENATEYNSDEDEEAESLRLFCSEKRWIFNSFYDKEAKLGSCLFMGGQCLDFKPRVVETTRWTPEEDYV